MNESMIHINLLLHPNLERFIKLVASSSNKFYFYYNYDKLMTNFYGT